MKNAKDIPSHLSYSEKIKGIVAGHQQETKQLLENIEELQDDVRHLLDENNALRAVNSVKDARIAELQAQVKQLASRPLNVNGPYIESANIERYLNLPPTPKRSRRIKLQISTNDLTLPLWESNLAS